MAYVGRGNAYIGSSETEETLSAAQADYKRAVELDDTNAQAYLGLADVYIRRGEYDKALEILKQGQNRTENNQDIADKIDEMEGGTIADSSGHIRRINKYDGDGTLTEYHIMEYDIHGNRICEYSYDNNNILQGYYTYEFDENGNKIKETDYNRDGLPNGFLLWEYDKTGEWRKESYYDADGKLTGFNVYEDDKMISYGENGQLTGYYTAEFDLDGKPLKQSHYSANNSLESYTILEYDTYGNQVKQSHYNADDVLEYYSVSIYDERNNQIGFEKYDGQGNLLYSEYVG